MTKPVDRAELWLRVLDPLRLKELGDLLEPQASDAPVDDRVEPGLVGGYQPRRALDYPLTMRNRDRTLIEVLYNASV